MRVEPYLEFIPEIERRLRLLQPDALVIGCGPSSYLLPWISQKLIAEPRRFGVHDVFRIVPVDDLIIMDPPRDWLNPNGDRFRVIIESRPKRWWFYPQSWTDPAREAHDGIPYWHKQMPECTRSAITIMNWQNFPPNRMPVKADRASGRHVIDTDQFTLLADPPQTTSLSPVGATTLAWHLGCRRIGVIGMDANQSSHPSFRLVPTVNKFMGTVARQAETLGGAIWNLSPISRVTKFNPPDCESSLEPTPGNVTPERRTSSASAS